MGGLLAGPARLGQRGEQLVEGLVALQELLVVHAEVDEFMPVVWVYVDS